MAVKGRDIALRAASAVVLAPAAVAATWGGGVWFLALLIVASVVLAFEWAAMSAPHARRVMGGAVSFGVVAAVIPWNAPFMLATVKIAPGLCAGNTMVMKTAEDAPPSCFLVPRVLEDGTRNPFALQRLKDKLGDRSNASSEIELDGTWGSLVGEEGRGVRTIIDMVSATRLDCVLGSAGTMRAALTRAVHHTRHRRAFGALLVDQPLMRNVLTDLALESEAASLLGMRLAHAVDEGETELTRLGVAVGKYWVCKRTSPFVAEALECLGGNGYVEENGMARLYRQAPLNSIWEGSGNVNALDVLRAIGREPASLMALLKEASVARGRLTTLDTALDEVERDCAGLAALDGVEAATGARRLVERLALTLQGSLMVLHSPAELTEAFVESRLGGAKGGSFGTLDAGFVATAAPTAIERASVTA